MSRDISPGCVELTHCRPHQGAAPLKIEKEVDGHVPPGTEFTVKVECVGLRGGPIIHTPNGSVASATVDFDKEGDPDGSDTITFNGPGTCTVTETHDGDAKDVSYECEGQFPVVSPPQTSAAPGDGGFVGAQQDEVADPCGGVAGPQEKPITVFATMSGKTSAGRRSGQRHLEVLGGTRDTQPVR